MAKLPFRPNVCILVFNSEGKLFLGERMGSPGIWQLPQGGIEQNSSAEETALREAHEEIGADLEKFKVLRKLKATHEYEFSDVPEYARGRFRGQSQSFWLIEYLGTDAEIVLTRYKPEFSAWRWCSAEEVRRCAEPKRVVGYEQALTEFEQFIANYQPTE